MKTSRQTSRETIAHFKRVATSLTLACVLVLPACSDERLMAPDVEVSTFKTAEDCRQSGLFTEEACKQAEQEAKRAYEQEAPLYDTLEQCQKDNEDCVQAWGRPAPAEEKAQAVPQQSAAEPAKSNETASHSSGSHFPILLFHPGYSGFMMPAQNMGTAAPVFTSKTDGLRTPSGIGGLHFGEAARVPPSSLKSAAPSFRSGAPAPASVRAAPAVRGGFGGAGFGSGG